MFGRRLLVELAPGLLLVELAPPLVELASSLVELEVPVVKQEVKARRITIKSQELALVKVAIRVHKQCVPTLERRTEMFAKSQGYLPFRTEIIETRDCVLCGGETVSQPDE